MELPRFVPADAGEPPPPFIPGPYPFRKIAPKYWKKRDSVSVKRRRRYKRNKTKKERIHCQQCNKRFTPKRTTAIYCGPLCRNQAHYQEHKYFRKFGLIDEWDTLLNDDYKATHSKLDFLRGEFNKILMGTRR